MTKGLHFSGFNLRSTISVVMLQESLSQESQLALHLYFAI